MARPRSLISLLDPAASGSVIESDLRATTQKCLSLTILLPGRDVVPVHAATNIRAVRQDDVAALKIIIDATELFPSQLLDGMLAGWLGGQRLDQRWQTYDAGSGPRAVAYSAPEPMTDGTSNLLLIAVHPEQQGHGIGQALMRDVEVTLAAHGQRVLLVETSGLPEFERTRDFYRRFGYTQEARIRDYYAAGVDKIVYWKALR